MHRTPWDAIKQAPAGHRFIVAYTGYLGSENGIVVLSRLMSSNMRQYGKLTCRCALKERISHCPLRLLAQKKYRWRTGLLSRLLAADYKAGYLYCWCLSLAPVRLLLNSRPRVCSLRILAPRCLCGPI